jgi:hypothetical protein
VPIEAIARPPLFLRVIQRIQSVTEPRILSLSRWSPLFAFLVLSIFVSTACLRKTSAAPPSQIWNYTLLADSLFVNDCPLCGRPTIPEPTRGTFQLLLLESGPFKTVYELQQIDLLSTRGADPSHRIRGKGTYSISAEFALLQEMKLELQIVHLPSAETNQIVMTNANQSMERPPPFVSIQLDEVTESVTRVFRLNLVAAPLREIWFTTASGITPADREKFPNRISSGDVLAFPGRVVKSNLDLLRHLGLMPGIPEIGIDALEIGPGGEIMFSLTEDAFSETLGPLSHGDLLSQRGRIVKKGSQLLAAFEPPAGSEDAGLDAIHLRDDGEVLFSITQQIESLKLGRQLSPGDLLSDRGLIWRAGKDLLAAFQPSDTQQIGLDAVYIWPHGEILFSTEQGFFDRQLGTITGGDLLSSAGYIVIRNLDLVGDFAPLEDLADFGLDGLFIATDMSVLSTQPKLIEINPSQGKIDLKWEGPGRVFQVEKSTALPGNFQSISPLLPDSHWSDVQLPDRSGFYRIRQW